MASGVRCQSNSARGAANRPSALWTSIGSMMLGFDYVIGSQLAALSEFKKYFGVQEADGTWIIPATYLSAWGAIGLGCDVIASWLAAPLLEKYGRKPLILFSAIVSVVAIILQQLATNWRVHLAGRAVNGQSRFNKLFGAH